MKKYIIGLMTMVSVSASAMDCVGMIMRPNNNFKRIVITNVENVGWHKADLEDVKFVIATFNNGTFRSGFSMSGLTSINDQQGPDFINALSFSEGPNNVKTVQLKCNN